MTYSVRDATSRDAEMLAAATRGGSTSCTCCAAVNRRGLGRLLVCRVADRFLGHGITSMLLFGDARSPSNGFYEHLGAERLLSAKGEFHGGYGWRDLAPLAQLCRYSPDGRAP